MIIGGMALLLAQAAAPGAGKPQPVDPTRWITDDDYPIDALRRSEQGSVGFVLDVGADGMTRACRVTSSSGSPMLDANACALLMQRAKFTPATDAAGRAVASSFSSRFTWRIPETPAVVQDEVGGATRKVTISRAKDGGYRCDATGEGKVAQLSARSCAEMADAMGRHFGKAVGTFYLSPPAVVPEP